MSLIYFFQASGILALHVRRLRLILSWKIKSSLLQSVLHRKNLGHLPQYSMDFRLGFSIEKRAVLAYYA